jgi:hypothetical protein
LNKSERLWMGFIIVRTTLCKGPVLTVSHVTAASRIQA